MGRFVQYARELGAQTTPLAPEWLIALEAHFSANIEHRSTLRGASLTRVMEGLLRRLEPHAGELATCYALGGGEAMLKRASSIILSIEVLE
jgi:hypothetical protein